MSKYSLSFLTSYFIIIPAIAALPPLSADFSFSVKTRTNNNVRKSILVLQGIVVAVVDGNKIRDFRFSVIDVTFEV